MRTPLQDNQEISVAERALTLWGDTVYRVALGQTGSRARRPKTSTNMSF